MTGGTGNNGTGEVLVSGSWPQVDGEDFRLLLKRWAEWRQGALVPMRSAVNPAVIMPCLPKMWMFRLVDGNTRVVCTLAGDRINEAWGFSIIGKDPMSLWGPDDGGFINRRLCRVALTPAIIFGKSEYTPVREEMGLRVARRLMLPLVGDDGAPYGAYGMTEFDFDPRLTLPARPPRLDQAWRYPCADLPPGMPPGPA